MIRLFKKDNSGFKDFQNNLFSTNLCSFDFAHNTVNIHRIDYYINNIVDLNECNCLTNITNNFRIGRAKVIGGITTEIEFSTPFDSENYILVLTAYDKYTVVNVEILDRSANGFVVASRIGVIIEYQAIYID